ncbi:isochorismatase family protein [uncultured Jannaschia sp.]|uniref:isochorismatase family protein n=1 Tax=uncultured Jannaschia sp. TaxID=293347 RepID=UPI00261391A2|nr:isochorismatase family protein [uncultured Jannaschia sp.]
MRLYSHAIGAALVLGCCISLPQAVAAQAQATQLPAERNAAEALQRLEADDAVLVLVDYTSGLFPIVDTIEVDEMLNNAVALAKVAETFDIPVMVVGSEGGYYGDLHPAIAAHAGEGQPFGRETPSAWDSGPLRAAIEATGRGTVLIGGISTDNCTLHTSLGMLRDGYDVRVITDISGADSAQAELAALFRLRDAGAITTNWISMTSELLDVWDSPEGEAVTQIYGRHINGPNAGVNGASTDDAGTGRSQEEDTE